MFLLMQERRRQMQREFGGFPFGPRPSRGFSHHDYHDDDDDFYQHRNNENRSSRNFHTGSNSTGRTRKHAAAKHNNHKSNCKKSPSQPQQSQPAPSSTAATINAPKQQQKKKKSKGNWNATKKKKKQRNTHWGKTSSDLSSNTTNIDNDEDEDLSDDSSLISNDVQEDSYVKNATSSLSNEEERPQENGGQKLANNTEKHSATDDSNGDSNGDSNSDCNDFPEDFDEKNPTSQVPNKENISQENVGYKMTNSTENSATVRTTTLSEKQTEDDVSDDFNENPQDEKNATSQLPNKKNISQENGKCKISESKQQSTKTNPAAAETVTHSEKPHPSNDAVKNSYNIHSENIFPSKPPQEYTQNSNVDKSFLKPKKQKNVDTDNVKLTKKQWKKLKKQKKKENDEKHKKVEESVEKGINGTVQDEYTDESKNSDDETPQSPRTYQRKSTADRDSNTDRSFRDIETNTTKSTNQNTPSEENTKLKSGQNSNGIQSKNKKSTTNENRKKVPTNLCRSSDDIQMPSNGQQRSKHLQEPQKKVSPIGSYERRTQKQDGTKSESKDRTLPAKEQPTNSDGVSAKDDLQYQKKRQGMINNPKGGQTQHNDLKFPTQEQQRLANGDVKWDQFQEYSLFQKSKLPVQESIGAIGKEKIYHSQFQNPLTNRKSKVPEEQSPLGNNESTSCIKSSIEQTIGTGADGYYRHLGVQQSSVSNAGVRPASSVNGTVAQGFGQQQRETQQRVSHTPPPPVARPAPTHFMSQPSQHVQQTAPNHYVSQRGQQTAAQSSCVQSSMPHYIPLPTSRAQEIASPHVPHLQQLRAEQLKHQSQLKKQHHAINGFVNHFQENAQDSSRATISTPAYNQSKSKAASSLDLNMIKEQLDQYLDQHIDHSKVDHYMKLISIANGNVTES